MQLVHNFGIRLGDVLRQTVCEHQRAAFLTREHADDQRKIYRQYLAFCRMALDEHDSPVKRDYPRHRRQQQLSFCPLTALPVQGELLQMPT